jgi:hypothetical protein
LAFFPVLFICDYLIIFFRFHVVKFACWPSLRPPKCERCTARLLTATQIFAYFERFAMLGF